MKLSEINIRDPFILTYKGKYYMYGTRAATTWGGVPTKALGFDVYESDDLESWSEPKPIFEYYDGFWGTEQFWAPEVHEYKGRFYLFATFNSRETGRGTAILVCDTPNGEFKEHSDGAVTPKGWECLDGTFYIEGDTPYIVFCHEWTQIKDGTVCALELSDDLKKSVGEPRLLWRGSDGYPWVSPHGESCYVTDGPFLIKLEDELICLWSSFCKDGYAEAISRSSNGKISGKWTVDEKLLFEKDGGHGMIFTDLLGKMRFVYHSPNETPRERPFTKIIEKQMLQGE